MPQAADCLSEGFSELLSIHGEAVSFRGQSAAAIINRSPKAEQLPNQPHFDFRNTSIVQCAVALAPEVADEFIDGRKFRHRVQSVQFLGHCYSCTCETSKA